MEAWDQQPDEGARAFAAFVLYRDMPPDKRSLLAAARLYSGKPDLKSVPGRIGKWSSDYHWIERATMNDARLDDLRRAAEAKAEQERTEVWAKRRIDIREEGFGVGMELLERAREILSLPVTLKKETEELVKEEVDSERGVIIQFVTRNVIIEPVGIRARDAALIARTALELARLAAGLETSRGLFDLDLENLTDEQLRRLASGRGIPRT